MERNFTKGSYHHIYNRGANQLEIFKDDGDYRYFLKKLNYCRTKYKIGVLGYCLMPNHFHLFVKQKTTELTVGKMIGSLINAYTKTINVKYNRSGVLFEGPTKSRHITEEVYFLWLFKYIALNPVKSGLVARPEDWEYSSLPEYLGVRKNELLDMKNFQDSLGSVAAIRMFLKTD
ncbi:MAG: transposase [Candidatus Neomarinimicrobiota bacterium]